MASINEKYPGLISTVLSAVSAVPSQFKSDEDFAMVSVSDTINSEGDISQHLEWLVTPPSAPNDVELRSASSMGSWSVTHTIGNIDEIIKTEVPASVSEPSTPAIASSPAPIQRTQTEVKNDGARSRIRRRRRRVFGLIRTSRPEITQTTIPELITPRTDQSPTDIRVISSNVAKSTPSGLNNNFFRF